MTKNAAVRVGKESERAAKDQRNRAAFTMGKIICSPREKAQVAPKTYCSGLQQCCMMDHLFETLEGGVISAKQLFHVL